MEKDFTELVTEVVEGYVALQQADPDSIHFWRALRILGDRIEALGEHVLEVVQ